MKWSMLLLLLLYGLEVESGEVSEYSRQCSRVGRATGVLCISLTCSTLWSIVSIFWFNCLNSAVSVLSTLVLCLLLRHRQTSDELALRSSCEGHQEFKTANSLRQCQFNSVCLVSVFVLKERNVNYDVYYHVKSCTALIPGASMH